MISLTVEADMAIHAIPLVQRPPLIILHTFVPAEEVVLVWEARLLLLVIRPVLRMSWL